MNNNNNVRLDLQKEEEHSNLLHSNKNQPHHDDGGNKNDKDETHHHDHHQHNEFERTRQTWADIYFQKNNGKKLPLPPILHANLEDMLQLQEEEGISSNSSNKKNILIVGDVHGCYQELLTLVETAKSKIYYHDDDDNNDDGKIDFTCVILVGDLCNKGPESLQVIQHVRKTPNWFAVRGNHDEGALCAMLGDNVQLEKHTYQWVLNNNNNNDIITDKDVEWLANLPYTIAIPSSFFEEEEEKKDTIIVHAGLIPGLPLSKHDNNNNNGLKEDNFQAMITMRNVQKHTSPLHSKHQNHPHDSHYTVTNQNEQAENKNISIMSWASQWKGPQRVIFGHDAKRGLQLYYFPSSNKKEKKDIMVAGLDTGACYGKKLTGIMLPSQTLVHVPSQKIYCSIDK